MKLAYRDKILLVMLVIILTVSLSYIFVIKPKFEDIDAIKQSVSDANDQLTEIENKIAQKDKIQSELDEYINKCNVATSAFLPPMKNYEVDRFIQKILDKYDFTYTPLTINGPEIVDLEVYSYTPEYLTYPLLGSSEESQEDENTIFEDTTSIILPANTIEIKFIASQKSVEDFLNKIIQKNNISGWLNCMSYEVSGDRVSGGISMTVYYLQPKEIVQ